MESKQASSQNKFALALKLVLKAHQNQQDKAGRPYIFHLLGVAGQAKTDAE